MLHWLYGTNILKITSIHSFIYGVCLCRSHDNLCESILFVNHVGLCLYLLSHLAFVYVCICVCTEMFVPCACGGQQNTVGVILQELSMLLLLLFKTGLLTGMELAKKSILVASEPQEYTCTVQCWGLKHTPPHLTLFTYVIGSTSVPSCL